MALALPKNGKITCLDINEETSKKAISFFKKAKVHNLIEFKIGPALKSLNEIKQQISSQFGIDPAAFSLWGDPPNFEFNTTEYEAKWDDEWILTIAKNPDTNPEILFSIYNNEPLTSTVVDYIEEIQRDIGTDISKVKSVSPQQQIFADFC